MQGSSSACQAHAVSCEPEQETSLELISSSGGNTPEHLEDTNIWKISLSNDKCAGHSIQLSPQPTSHASAGSGGVGFWGGCLLIGSKHCQHSFVGFFPWEWGTGGKALLCSWPLAQKASEETCYPSPPSQDPLNTTSGYSALLFKTPAVT